MRWIVRVAVAVVFVIGCAIGALFLIPSERIAGLAASQFEGATGRALRISGEISPTVFPQIGVRVEGAEVANAPWSENGPLISAATLDVGVDVVSLLRGRVQVERLVISEPTILLERATNGAVNWSFEAEDSSGTGVSDAQPSGAVTAKPSTGGLPDISLGSGTINNGSLIFLDHGANTQTRLEAVDLTLTLPSLQARASVEGSALYNGAAVAFSGAVEGVQTFLDGALVPAEVSVSAGGTKAALSGRLGLEPLGFEGSITADSRERTQVFAALGQVPPSLPQGLGRGRIGLTSDLTLASSGSLHLRNMTLELDGNTLNGDVDVTTDGPRPKVMARVTAGALDLRGLSEKGRVEAGEADAGAAGWGTDRIDVSGLSAVDLEVSATTGAISLGDATLDSVSAKVVLDAGRAVLTLNPLRAYGGSVSGDVIVNGRNGLSSRVNVTLAGLQMQPFLTEFVDYDRLVGEANGAVNVLAVGNTMDALMKSLDGEGRVSIGKGELLGLDLAGMLRNFDASYRGEGSKTIFDGVQASFRVTEGILRNEDLSLAAPLVTAEGSGVVNIGAQTLDYRVIPTVLRGEDKDGVAVPVLITGTWANPKFRPDLEFLLDQELEAERAALEAEAKAKAEAAKARAEEAVKAKVAEELGVDAETLESGEDVEDALKKKLEDELKGALGGLLGGN